MEVEAFDLERMFLGDMDAIFLLEIVFRTVFMYGFALLLIRALGKRGLGQIAPFEFVIIIALGSAVGDPMFSADVPLLHSMVVVSLVVVMNQTLSRATQNNRKLEAYVQSYPACLVKDGRLEVETLARERISRDEVFSAMRLAGAEHLGQVKRAYLEPNGQFSAFLGNADEVRPGLSLCTPGDEARDNPLGAGAVAPEEGDYACAHCGHSDPLKAGDAVSPCPSCGDTIWEPAMTSVS